VATVIGMARGWPFMDVVAVIEQEGVLWTKPLRAQL
jgi:hypothetical protein